jgi:hypothetical protein
VAICLSLISFSYSQSGEEGAPKNLFAATLRLNLSKYCQFGDMLPLSYALAGAPYYGQHPAARILTESF